MKAHRILRILAIVVPLAGCGLLDKRDDDPPVLYNLGVQFGAYEPQTGRAGALVLDTNLTSVFTEFGTAGPSFGYAFVVATGSDVVSPLSGRVSSLSYDDASSTYTVRIRPKSDSVWTVRLSNLSAPAIADGDTLAAGEPLGVAGPGAPLGYAELSLRVDETAEEKAYCPLAVFDVATAGSAGAALVSTLQAFEALKGDAAIWDEGSWVLPGCTSETVPY